MRTKAEVTDPTVKHIARDFWRGSLPGLWLWLDRTGQDLIVDSLVVDYFRLKHNADSERVYTAHAVLAIREQITGAILARAPEVVGCLHERPCSMQAIAAGQACAGCQRKPAP